MEVLIFEDESLTAERLIMLLKKYDAGIKILDVIETVKDGVVWLQNHPSPDLIFMDIHLADGSGFEIFSESNIDTPVIFTTAYDKYALQAFKVNSVDYLLKPIDFEELTKAISKHKNLIIKPNDDVYKALLKQMTTSYRQRFLVRIGEQYKNIAVEDIAYFIHDEGIVFAYTHNAKRYMVNESIEELENALKPDDFYRINRKMIIGLTSIDQIHKHFNNRLKLKLNPDIQEEVFVSREKVADFKNWLNK